MRAHLQVSVIGAFTKITSPPSSPYAKLPLTFDTQFVNINELISIIIWMMIAVDIYFMPNVVFKVKINTDKTNSSLKYIIDFNNDT